MSEAVKQFIEGWVDNNIRAEGYQPDGNNSEALQRATECRITALENGYSAADLDAAAQDMFGGGDSLVDLIANAIESANDAECERQSERDG